MVTVDGLCPGQRIDDEVTGGTAVVSFEEAGPIVTALSSTISRQVLAALETEPMNAAAVADRVGTTLQNVGYHLDRLVDVGLVTTVGTQYSEKGREIDVYAATVDTLVIRPTSTSHGHENDRRSRSDDSFPPGDDGRTHDRGDHAGGREDGGYDDDTRHDDGTLEHDDGPLEHDDGPLEHDDPPLVEAD